MNIERTLLEIDKNTGDVNACLELLKRHKYTHRDLYCLYKQYWILIYIVGMDLDTFDDCKSIPLSERLKKICAWCPKGLKYFPDHSLKKLLKLSDTELVPIFLNIWGRLPKDLLIDRILRAQNPEAFMKLNIKVDKLPDLEKFSCSTLKTLMIIANADLLPSIIYAYYNRYTEDFLLNYVESKKTGGFEKSISLENFRIIKVLMQSLDYPISSCFLHLAKNILSSYMSPPVISPNLLPFEFAEILSELTSQDLEDLKSFVFKKMIAFNTRSQMALMLESCGVNCAPEIKLQKLKETVIQQMPEEAALELLACQDYSETEDLVMNWKKQKIFNNLLAP